METIRYLEGVSTLVINEKACSGCGMCEIVCPHGVFEMENGQARVIDLNGCMECGACATNCQGNAIELTPGVGCAGYIIQSWIKGKDKACCGPAGCC